MGSRIQRAADAEARRERIVDVSMRHFAEHGYRGARVEDIATEVGIAKGTVFLDFTSKEGLFLAAYQRAVSSLPAWLDAPEDVVESGFWATLDWWLERVWKNKPSYGKAHSAIHRHLMNAPFAAKTPRELPAGEIEEFFEEKTRTPGPKGKPLGGFFWTAASSAAGARDARGLGPAWALNDGDPGTTWASAGDGRGEWVSARSSTTDVSTCRAGIDQYVRSSAAARSAGTSANPWRR